MKVIACHAAVVILFVGACSVRAHAQEGREAAGVTKPYTISFQPKAVYTDRARNKGVEGAVRLKIMLLASGEVGAVTLVEFKNWKKMQKYGLVDRAIEAAKQIRFTPKMVNGIPVSVLVTREYTFTIY
jgi:TonB family protein